MRVLLTGASGTVAGLLLPALQERYDLRRADRRGTGDGLLTGDLADPAFAAEAVAGMDTVIHLAANPDPGAAWDDLYGPNVRAAATVLDAAAGHGVGTVVLASSLHAMGGHLHAGRFPVDPAWAPAPCCPYGATKGFAEAAGRMAAHRYGMRVISLRLGAVNARMPAREAASSWLAPDDLRSLVVGAVESDVPYGVYHGVSANTRQRWDIADAARDLGYHPVHDSEPHLAGAPELPGYGPCPPLRP